jgi:undecaprenyl diphosphate synthase
VVNATARNDRLLVQLFISYGARAELVRAARKLAEAAVEGRLDPADIDEDAFRAQLYTNGGPDPDLLIRTSGEQRISNFMLWQLAYTELHIIPVLWPDFTRRDLFAAILEYQSRERRFGKVTA